MNPIWAGVLFLGVFVGLDAVKKDGISFEIEVSCTIVDKWCFQILTNSSGYFSDKLVPMHQELCSKNQHQGIRIQIFEGVVGNKSSPKLGIMHNCTTTGEHSFYGSLLPEDELVKYEKTIKVKKIALDVNLNNAGSSHEKMIDEEVNDHENGSGFEPDDSGNNATIQRTKHIKNIFSSASNLTRVFKVEQVFS